jgi:anti-anti-sigma regulatory factor
LTVAIAQKQAELGQSVSPNLIINLCNCNIVDAGAYSGLINMHTDSYSKNHSLVFTGISETVMEDIKKNNIDTALNIAPTLIEAIDIISMEILERDLLNEE